MFPLKKILAPTDFSDASYRAIEIANEMAVNFNSELFIVHVVPNIPVVQSPITPIDTPTFDVSKYQHGLEKNAEKQLEDIIKKRTSQEVKTDIITLQGNAADEIVHLAKDKGIGLIVIATHGESGFKHLVFGSVAERVIRTASCPVLTIREHDKD